MDIPPPPPPPPRPDITPWVLVPPDLREPRPDPLWVSALRGRLLAVLASGGSLILSGDALWRLYGHIRAEGLTAEHLSTLSALSGSAYDAVTALSVSVLSLVALAAAGLSKLRERRRPT